MTIRRTLFALSLFGLAAAMPTKASALCVAWTANAQAYEQFMQACKAEEEGKVVSLFIKTEDPAAKTKIVETPAVGPTEVVKLRPGDKATIPTGKGDVIVEAEKRPRDIVIERALEPTRYVEVPVIRTTRYHCYQSTYYPDNSIVRERVSCRAAYVVDSGW